MRTTPHYNDDGTYDFWRGEWIRQQAEGMRYPVLCDCGSVYDSAAVTVTARYADCSVWTTPCCKRTEDDRPGTRRYRELR